MTASTDSELNLLQPTPLHRARGWIIAACSILALVWVLTARIAGPSDAWDQTQPKTLSYTTDIIVSGRWILPLERGEFPATKPPLYNWMAAPFVAVFGFANETAHKLPSILACIFCWAITVVLGRRIVNPQVGWLAGLMLAASHTFFKLGYLARPDMVLTLWILLGWLACTNILISENRHTTRDIFQTLRCIGFWLCIGLGFLTKGPAILVLIAYAIIASRFLGGSWSLINRLRWWWGAPLACGIVGLWIYGVWRIDPEHLLNTLWGEEIVGRLTGTGAEGAQKGPITILTGLPLMPLYFLRSFAPWSVCTVLGLIVLWRRDQTNVRLWHWQLQGHTGHWLHGAGLMVIVVIAFFSFSASRRADYLAGSIPMAALIGAWWMKEKVSGTFIVGIQKKVPDTFVFSVVASVVLIVLTVVNIRQPSSPQRGFGDSIQQFIVDCKNQIESQPGEVVFCRSGLLHVKAFMGVSQSDNGQRISELAEIGQPFWIIAGRNETPPQDFGDWLKLYQSDVKATVALRSPMMPFQSRLVGWPSQMTLFRVEPIEETR